MILINNNNNDKGLSLPMSAVSIIGFNGQRDGRSSGDAVNGNSVGGTRSDYTGPNAILGTPMTSATSVTSVTTATSVTSAVQLRLYDFEATLQFVDCDEDGEDGEDGVEADVNRTLSSGERLTIDLDDGQADYRPTAD
jgi:hypothetical protein